MGMNLHVHIGAYAEIKAERKVEWNELQFCKQHGHMRAAYCPHCGKPTDTVKNQIKVKPSFYDLLPEDEYCDMLSWAAGEDDLDVILAVGNWNTDESRLDVNVDGGATVSEITLDMPARFIEAFNAEYAEVLAVLRERAISVDVKFGVLTWWS